MSQEDKPLVWVLNLDTVYSNSLVLTMVLQVFGITILRYNLQLQTGIPIISEFHCQHLLIMVKFHQKLIMFVSSKLSTWMTITKILTKLFWEVCSFNLFMHAIWCMVLMLYKSIYIRTSMHFQQLISEIKRLQLVKMLLQLLQLILVLMILHHLMDCPLSLHPSKENNSVKINFI